MANVNLQERAITASMKYLEAQSFENVERFEDNFIVADEEGELVFANVVIKDGDFGGIDMERGEYEEVAMRYFIENDVVGVPVRFDEVALIVCGESRAFLRHCRNCMLEG